LLEHWHCEFCISTTLDPFNPPILPHRVAAVGVLIYCLCCRGKGEDDEEEAGEEEEDAEKGEAGDPKKEASGGDE